MATEWFIQGSFGFSYFNTLFRPSTTLSTVKPKCSNSFARGRFAVAVDPTTRPQGDVLAPVVVTRSTPTLGKSGSVPRPCTSAAGGRRVEVQGIGYDPDGNALLGSFCFAPTASCTSDPVAR